MRTGRARALLLVAMLFAIGGCATSQPRAILSAAEIDSMIRVDVEALEPAPSEDAMVARVQP